MNSKQHMSYPYPFMWVPPEFMKNKEPEKHADIVKADKVSHGADHQPNGWDGCIPIDMDTLSSLLESEKEKDGQREEEQRKFLFPNIWMPSYHEQSGNPKGGKEISSDDVPYTIKFIPVTKSGKDGSENSLKSEEMQKGSFKNKNIECPGGKGRRGSTALHKTSKSAPVCLRVDPLPKKRSQTRSSSPSGRRGSCGMLEKLAGDLNSSGQMDPDREKIVQVVEVKKSECRQADENHHPASNNSKEGQQMVNKEMKSQGVAETATSEPRMKKKIWSDAEAAELIQSVYRGYTVRKWDSLRKLKQLSEVKMEVENVRNRVEHLLSPHPGDEKEKIMIGELIMRLLLKLDTIQGLLPFVREMRKSLAKELDILQGMVDEISVVPSGQSTEENIPNREKNTSGETIELLPIMENVVDEEPHQFLDCPSETLESDDVKATGDEAASVSETAKDVELVGVMENVTIADEESQLEDNSSVAAGEDTVAVDAVNNGQLVVLEDSTSEASPTNIVKHDSTEPSVVLNPGPGEGVLMTGKAEEEEEATMEHFSKTLTPITGDALFTKEVEVGVVEFSRLDSINLSGAGGDPALDQNQQKKDLIQMCNDSAYAEVINSMPASGTEMGATDDEIESVNSDTAQPADVYKDKITSGEPQSEQLRDEAVEEEGIMVLHSEFQNEENEEAREPKGESESSEEGRGEEEKIGGGQKVKEEEELREMLEKLMEVGKEQVNLISNLSCRVKQLEKQLKKQKMKKKMPRSKLFPNRVSLLCN